MIAPKQKKYKRSNAKIQQPNYQVFVSHATADKWIAKTICEKIEKIGASTFRDDRDINGGDDIPDEIRKKITLSQEFLVLLTPDSLNRTWILLEVGAAWSWRKQIVPVLVHLEVDPIPAIIKSKKAIKINDFDNYLRELSARIEKRKNGKKT